jgi:hypothetical protein
MKEKLIQEIIWTTNRGCLLMVEYDSNYKIGSTIELYNANNEGVTTATIVGLEYRKKLNGEIENPVALNVIGLRKEDLKMNVLYYIY